MPSDAPQDHPSADDDATRPGLPDDSMPPLTDGPGPTGSIGSTSGDRLSAIFDVEPASQAAHDELVGTVIGDTRIIRVIGQGGMGRVYEGYQERLALTVAVKVMRPGLVATPGMQQQFDYEAKILARLQHPGIARIFSAGVEPLLGAQVPYFIMDYIPEARTLTRYAEDLKLPTRLRLDLFRKVCDAVAHGHQNGIVHRDLKPSNILVDAKGQPKVIDFGVAKATDSDLALKMMQPNLNWIMGTFQYMGPEQMDENPNAIDIRCDVYALGVVLYELLTGQLPYDVRQKVFEEAKRIVREAQPTPLVAFDKTLGRNVAAIAGKCLEKDRDRRYASASALGDDVGRHLAGEPITAVPPSLIDNIRWFARKHRAAVAATVGVFAALVAAVIGISMFYRTAVVARARAEAERLAADEARVRAETAESVAQHEKNVATQRLYATNMNRLNELLTERNFSSARTLFAEFASPYVGKSLPIELACIDARMNQASLVFPGNVFTGYTRLPSANLALSSDGTHLAATSGYSVRVWDAHSGQQLADIIEAPRRVTAFTFSPDGTQIAAASETGVVRIWNVQTDKQQMVLEGHVSAIGGLAYSPDGTRIATGSDDGKVMIWDARTGDKLMALEGSPGITTIQFSPDNTRLVTGARDQLVRIWNAQTGEKFNVLKILKGEVWVVRFIMDGSGLATYSGREGFMRLWDVETAQELKFSKGPVKQVSPRGDLFVTSTPSQASGVTIWEAATGKQIKVLEDSNSSVAFSPTSDRFATLNGGVRIWGKGSERPIVFEGDTDGISSLIFSPDGTRFYTGHKDGTVELWDIDDVTESTILEGAKGPFKLSPDGERIVSTDGFWDAYTGDQVAHPHYECSPFDSQASVAFSPDGSRIIVGQDYLSCAQLLDANTGRQLVGYSCPEGKCNILAYSANGRRFAFTSGDVIRIWDVPSNQQITVLHDYSEKLFFSPDGTRVVTEGAFGEQGSLWDANTGKRLAVLEPRIPSASMGPMDSAFGHDGGESAEVYDDVDVVAFSPDGTQFATGSGRWHGDGSVRLWDSSTGRQRTVLEGHSAGITEIIYSPNGTLLATHASGDEQARLWDVASGSLLAVLEDTSYLFCFSRDGSLIATLATDGSARIWSTNTGKNVTRIQDPASSIRELIFSPDGTRIVTGAGDDKVRIWDANSGMPLTVLEHEGPVRDFAFRSDGHCLVTRSASRRVDDKTEDIKRGHDKDTVRLWGLTREKIYRTCLEAAAIEERLDGMITEWLADGPDAAVAKLQSRKASMTSEEYRVAGNMILARSIELQAKCSSSPPEPWVEMAVAEALPEDTSEITTLTAEQARRVPPHNGYRAVCGEGELLLDGLTTLPPDVALELAQRNVPALWLNGLTTLSPAAAQALAQFKGTLWLGGLTTLSPETAQGLARHEGRELNLDRLAALSDEAARALSGHENILVLDGLTALSEEAAQSLSQHKGKELRLNGLTELSDETAKALARHKGRLLLNSVRALSNEAGQWLSQHDGGLWLNGLVLITPEIAGVLVKRDGELLLNGVTSLSPEVAKVLARHKGVLALNGLTTLSPEIAKALAKHHGSLELHRLTGLSGDEAKALAEHNGPLDLAVKTTPSNEAFQALAQAKGPVNLMALSLEARREWWRLYEQKRTGSVISSATDGLSNDAALRLAEHRGPVFIDSLTSLSDEAAQAFAKHEGRLSINRLITLSPAAARALAGNKGILSLDGLTMLSDEAAEALALHEEGDLRLNGLTSLSDEAAKALSRHKGDIYLEGLTTLSPDAAAVLQATKRTHLPDQFR